MSTQGMPPGWTYHTTPEGAYFFCNQVENFSTWYDPRSEANTAMPAGFKRHVDQRGRAYFGTPAGGTVWCDPRKKEQVPKPPPDFVRVAGVGAPPPPPPEAAASPGSYGAPAAPGHYGGHAPAYGHYPSAPAPTAYAPPPGAYYQQPQQQPSPTSSSSVAVSVSVGGSGGGSSSPAVAKRAAAPAARDTKIPVTAATAKQLVGRSEINEFIEKVTDSTERIYANLRKRKDYYEARREELKSNIAALENCLKSLFRKLGTFKQQLVDPSLKAELARCFEATRDCINLIEKRCKGNALAGAAGKDKSFFGSKNLQEMAASIRKMVDHSGINIDDGTFDFNYSSSISVDHNTSAEIRTQNDTLIDAPETITMDQQIASP